MYVCINIVVIFEFLTEISCSVKPTFFTEAKRKKNSRTCCVHPIVSTSVV